ncbi:CCA tRNA nucleotidyltransferase [Brevundimonas balnearis]|uniref:CCA tRNA nucleotidyltransferase n=1 Tax=Brevundimonas balnearis TaxID=1572858 RepID=A0ABV6R2P1_9CAUL
MTRLTGQPWLTAPATRAVLDALEAEGGAGCARFVGGSVRNALMGRAVDDVDIATPLTPERVIAALERAGLKAVPTGVEHGTVTAVAERRPFEITTLRRDVSTDGRRATVAFTDDWAEDAARRDFRLNALYADGDGQVFDPTGLGVEDAQAGRIVFVGEPERRIREDYLRILRFFRFMAWYGRGAPDAEGLAACAALKDGLKQLSAERVSKELLKLLSAPDPRRAVQAMADAGVLAEVLPEVGDLARFAALSVEHDDPLLRLAALLPDEAAGAEAVARRLRLSNAQRARLVAALDPSAAVRPTMGPEAGRAALYRLGRETALDRLALAEAVEGAASPALRRLFETWPIPRMPVGGADLARLGVAPGPETGRLLKRFEEDWIAADFPASGHAARLQQLLETP